MVKIAPSLLSSDFSNLASEIKKLEKAGADLLHFDVMDGCFVPNLTFGAQFIKSVRNTTSLPFDVHLMINDPDNKIDWFSTAGSDIITVHAEACNNLRETLQKIRYLGCKSAVSLKPQTPLSAIENLYNDIDMVLIMSVEPGFGGQKFMDDQLNKVSQLKQIIGSKNIEIEIDGGINLQTAPMAVQAGADILVAGTAIFKDGKYQENIIAIQQAIGER
ncbi:MAG: ribulose-phosphate 3-epimerase [Alphaproteobacteria bacterium]|nr:ribulose-phosphate 3-epimerase [Alphaproteobacteria bacterium]